MKLRDITAVIEEMVPLKLAQDWDNVGLLIGDPQQDIKGILLTIDTTAQVLAEARKRKTDLIISYHPVIWDALRKITTDTSTKVVYELIRSRIAVFSMHTALDSALGGVNDGLAEIVGISNAEAIGDYVESPAGDNYKLVIFVPVEAAASVANAVFAAGAGLIGNYSHCGFEAAGRGSFRPLKGARPAVGRKGKFEKVDEVRFESIVPADKLAGCIAAMKKAHPYETPAFDCYRLHTARAKLGLGRIGTLQMPVRVEQIVQKLKKHTGAKAVGIVGDAKKMVKTAAVCAGSCGKIINTVITSKADCYVTGELKHHYALAAQESGLTCICLGHTVSERFILKKLAGQLQNRLPQVRIAVSRKDSEPFVWKKI